MKNRIISVIGLGYVGLPVAIAFAQKYLTIGFDSNLQRLQELQQYQDQTGEISSDVLQVTTLKYTDNLQDLKQANFHIITVPTPIDQNYQPDLTQLFAASQTIGKILKPGDIVIYESTVYPGLTEEECIPLLEKYSGLKSNQDFSVGYSPERINPGDQNKRFTKIKKIIAAQNSTTVQIIEKIYASVIEAGIYIAPDIKTAEAAKVIENTQRDLNIALVNEFAMLFHQMGLNTQEVLKAAATKWNFIPFQPGLVGGHCIGVDPYYLTYQAEKIGYNPQVILSGRKINDGMGKYIAQQTIQELQKNHELPDRLIITILGLTFKENCPDLRNSRVIDIINELKKFNAKIQIHDPIASNHEAEQTCNLQIQPLSQLQPAHAMVVAVAHQNFIKLSGQNLKKLLQKPFVLIDIKGIFDIQECRLEGINIWQL